MPMRQNPLIYPAGFSPGFDPSHVASRRGPVLFSVANLGSGFVNLLNGKPGTTAGSPTQLIVKGAGPSSKMAANADGYTFPVSTATPSAQTLAAVATFDSFTAFAGILAASGNSGYLASGADSGHLKVLNTDVVLNGTMVTGRPYFVLATISAAGRFVTVRDLVTGAIYTGSDTGATPSAPSGTGYVGANNGLVAGCTISAAMAMSGALNTAEQLAWASDPWAFWYPSASVTKLSSQVGVAGGASPSGSLATTEAADVAALVGTVSDQGTLAATDTADTLAFAGNADISGTLAATEAADVLAFSGVAEVKGTLSAADAPDALAFAGTVADQGTLAATDPADAVAVSGTVSDQGTLAATDAQDVVAFSGNADISGTLATTESADIPAFVGAPADTGTLDATESPDVLAFASATTDGQTVLTNRGPGGVALSRKRYEELLEEIAQEKRELARPEKKAHAKPAKKVIKQVEYKTAKIERLENKLTDLEIEEDDMQVLRMMFRLAA